MAFFIRIALILTSFVLFFNCSPKNEPNADSSSVADSTAVAQEAEETGVSGDFDGDGVQEKILAKLLKDAHADSEDTFSYSIEFANPKINSIEVSSIQDGGYMLLNEGDIDGKPGDELSIVICDIDNEADLRIYTLKDSKWNQIAESVNVVCTLPDNLAWENVVTKTDSGVYALELQMLRYDSIVSENRKVILSSASGDFDGNGEAENVYVKTIHDSSLDDSGYWEYSIVFANTLLPPLTIENHEAGGCEVENSGNTDERPGDELSVTRYGTMSKVITDVYAFNGKEWKIMSSRISTRN
jgi:hypothetical protein